MDSDWHLLTNLVLSRGLVDRSAHLRADADWQAARRHDARSRVMRVSGGLALAQQRDADAVELEFASVEQLDAAAELTFLGVDDDDVAYFAEHVAERDEALDVEGVTWTDLRSCATELNARDAGLMVTAVALDNWLRTHSRCPRCGTPTQYSAAGWARRCPRCGSEHFPRTDPAVIMLVRDDEDRALLGRHGLWSGSMFSTLAGFVESGESAEAAVRREVLEEAGVVVGTGPGDLRYLGSQPWPFPCSLMLGYHAWAADTSITTESDELAEARWFSRAELRAACEAGEVSLPGSISIAHRLVERWFGEPIPGAWCRRVSPARR